MTDEGYSDMERDRVVDFAVIGAQKCATSWLYYCLQDHPQIRIPRNKIEPGYIGGAMFQERGEEWFFDRYDLPAGERATGDVSVDYLYHPEAAGVLRQYMPRPRLIVSLRNPVERLLSAYYWMVRKNQLPNRPPERGLKYLLTEPSDFPKNLTTELADLVGRGRYAEQLAGYMEVFEPQDFLVVLYSDICGHPRTVINRIYDFIGVDDNYTPRSIYSRPKKNTYNKFLLGFERGIQSKVIAKLADYANQWLGKIARSRPAAGACLWSELRSRYHMDVLKTAEVLRTVPATQRPADEILDELWR